MKQFVYINILQIVAFGYVLIYLFFITGFSLKLR